MKVHSGMSVVCVDQVKRNPQSHGCVNHGEAGKLSSNTKTSTAEGGYEKDSNRSSRDVVRSAKQRKSKA